MLAQNVAIDVQLKLPIFFQKRPNALMNIMQLSFYAITLNILIVQTYAAERLLIKPSFAPYCNARDKCRPECSCDFAQGCSLLPMDDYIRKTILVYLNQIRNVHVSVEPQPGGMTMLKYDLELEEISRCWAARCEEDYSECFMTSQYNETSQAVGQTHLNVGESPNVMMWISLFNSWLGKPKSLTAETISSLPAGENGEFLHNYVLLATDRVLSVGCAWSSLGNAVTFICTYGPKGPTQGQPIYQIGKPCTLCPPSYSCDSTSPFQQLCSEMEGPTVRAPPKPAPPPPRALKPVYIPPLPAIPLRLRLPKPSEAMYYTQSETLPQVPRRNSAPDDVTPSNEPSNGEVFENLPLLSFLPNDGESTSLQDNAAAQLKNILEKTRILDRQPFSSQDIEKSQSPCTPVPEIVTEIPSTPPPPVPALPDDMSDGYDASMPELQQYQQRGRQMIPTQNQYQQRMPKIPPKLPPMQLPRPLPLPVPKPTPRNLRPPLPPPLAPVSPAPRPPPLPPSPWPQPPMNPPQQFPGDDDIPPIPGQGGGRPPSPPRPEDIPPIPGQNGGRPPSQPWPDDIPPIPGQGGGRPPLQPRPDDIPPIPGQGGGRPPSPRRPDDIPPIPGQGGGRPPLQPRPDDIPPIPGPGGDRPPSQPRPDDIPPIPGQRGGRPPSQPRPDDFPSIPGKWQPSSQGRRGDIPPTPGQNAWRPPTQPRPDELPVMPRPNGRPPLQQRPDNILPNRRPPSDMRPPISRPPSQMRPTIPRPDGGRPPFPQRPDEMPPIGRPYGGRPPSQQRPDGLLPMPGPNRGRPPSQQRPGDQPSNPGLYGAARPMEPRRDIPSTIPSLRQLQQPPMYDTPPNPVPYNGPPTGDDPSFMPPYMDSRSQETGGNVPPPGYTPERHDQPDTAGSQPYYQPPPRQQPTNEAPERPPSISPQPSPNFPILPVKPVPTRMPPPYPTRGAVAARRGTHHRRSRSYCCTKSLEYLLYIVPAGVLIACMF